ncbi:hypothetical protein ABR737_01485 [Streptomyces sp. Edi2]|uniref:hypothetical protein n=1 Tax=Streptomyces sp. Edi2 TaxID=3162528 RepID=UPI003305723B
MNTDSANIAADLRTAYAHVSGPGSLDPERVAAAVELLTKAHQALVERDATERASASRRFDRLAIAWRQREHGHTRIVRRALSRTSLVAQDSKFDGLYFIASIWPLADVIQCLEGTHDCLAYLAS